jgi:hypothetical protein
MEGLNFCALALFHKPINLIAMKHIITFFATVSIALLPMFALTSCGKLAPGGKTQDTSYRYCISISFSDIVGKDLVAPLGDERWKPANDHSYWYGEINPDKYGLDISLSNPPHEIQYINSPKPEFERKTGPYFKMAKYDNNYQLTSNFGKEVYTEGDGLHFLSNEYGTPIYHYADDNYDRIIEEPIQEHITYKISCPTIFGDNSVHELVAYWADDPDISYDSQDARTWYLYPECIRASFDGKEVAVKKSVVNTTEYRDYYSYFINIILDK